uniref:DUF985 domain-containing protein n=1 Tax=Cyanothece sp. (strain PCC 7425 / ATCC 29141) TaxID=395961 RepID=B8HVB1_CYAP4
MTTTAADWVKTLQLSPHPEGGYFRETYRSPESLDRSHLPDRFGGPRCFSTAIYFLLESGQFSTLHRIQSDEVWHFYSGGSLTVYAIAPGGELNEIKLGNNPEAGESWQAVVPAGYWFGAAVNAANSYALVGCTVAPGFDFADFELGDRTQLLQKFPQHQALIEKLTHPPLS